MNFSKFHYITSLSIKLFRFGLVISLDLSPDFWKFSLLFVVIILTHNSEFVNMKIENNKEKYKKI